MEIKGTALVSTKDFIEKKFGDDGYKKWLTELPEKTAKIYSESILLSQWYPLKESLIEPSQVMCDMFFKSDVKGAWEAGRHSADFSLKGIYRIFVKMGSPQFIAQRASVILPLFYKPSKMSAEMLGNTTCSIKIHEFSDICDIIENRIGGWIEMALELSGGKSRGVEITKSLTSGHEYTEFIVNFE